MILYQIWKRYGIKINSALSVFITFNFINVSWVVFRADNISEAVIFIKSMFSFERVVLPVQLISLHEIFKPLEFMVGYHPVAFFPSSAFIAFGLCLLTFKNSHELTVGSIFNSKISLAICFVVLTYGLLKVGTLRKFIYFEF